MGQGKIFLPFFLTALVLGVFEGAPASPLWPKEFLHEKKCLLCHLDQEQGTLAMLDGTPLAEQDSLRLCSQCHGKVYFDWKALVHGKRLSLAKGPESCLECHDAHEPKFEKMKADAPPRRPRLHKTFNEKDTHGK